jgi:hypothetical protein
MLWPPTTPVDAGLAGRPNSDKYIDGSPELVPAFALMNAEIYLEMQFNARGSKQQSDFLHICQSRIDTDRAFTSGLANGGVLENLVLTDWNKLNTIGTNLENAHEGGP